MTETPRPVDAAIDRQVIARRPPSWLRRVSVGLAVLGALALLAGLATAVRGTSAPAAATGGVLGADALRIEYAEGSSYVALSYRHGETVRYALELRNDGPAPVTIESVPLGELQAQRRLLHPTGVQLAPAGASSATVEDGTDLARFEPFTLARGEARTLVVEGVFYNCAYYTERAVDLVTSLPVTWSVMGLRETTEVALPEQMAVRSPHMRICPGRVMDRGAMTRSDGG